MDAIKDGKSTNLEGIADVLGTKNDKEPDTKEPVTKLEPVPGDEPKNVEPPKDDGLQDGGPEPAVKPPAPEPDPLPPVDDGGVPDSLLPEDQRTTPPEPTDPPAPDDDEKLIASMPEKQGERFKAMRLELKQAKEALKAGGVGKPSEEQTKALEEANKQLAEAHNTIARLNLSEDPRFKAKYDTQTNFILSQIKEQAKAFEYDENIVDALVGMGVRERMEFIQNNAPHLKDVAMPLFTQIDMVNNNRREELAQAQAQMGQMAEMQDKQISEMRTKTLHSTVSKASQAGHFLFTQVEGNDAWNQSVAQNVKAAEEILASNDVALQTEAIALGSVANKYLELYHKERSARVAATNQLAKYQKAGGHVRNVDGASDGAPPSKTPSSLTPDEMLKELEKKKAKRK